jgi:indolepyruvate ferredoxin oxidoreductase
MRRRFARSLFRTAPPSRCLRRRGHPIKREYGPWIWHAFRVLTKLKFLRGTLFDPLGYTAERRIERQLIAEYRGDVEKLLEHLNETNLAEAAELAGWPEDVRGYGHVKDACVFAIRAKRNQNRKEK